MGFLFLLSNITLPLLLLCYKTTLRHHAEGHVGFGQFFSIIVFTFLTNLLYFFLSGSLFFLLLDFACKMFIVFMPQAINAQIERKVSYLHLEILLEKIRSQSIEKFFLFNEFIMSWAIAKMDEVESKHFKNAIIEHLQSAEKANSSEGKTNGFASELQNAYKHYESIEVECNIITLEMIENAQKETEKEKQKFTKYLSEKTAEIQPMKESNNDKSKIQSEQADTKKKNSSFLMKKSSKEIFEEPNENKLPPNINTSFKKDKSQEKVTKQPQMEKQPQTKKQPEVQPEEPLPKKQSIIESEPSMILNKLDASEYSDMFKEQQVETEDRKAVCKVEAIVEIGQASGVRLEIYNIELYQNDDIRIISLYGREFEKYKLVGMKQQKHGYYQLQLSGGSLDKRRVKFRGQIDAFKRYIQPK